MNWGYKATLFDEAKPVTGLTGSASNDKIRVLCLNDKIRALNKRIGRDWHCPWEKDMDGP